MQDTHMRFTPAVFAVDHEYQIMVPVQEDSIFWVMVGDNTYYDDCCGVLRSDTRIHRVIVPMEVLDKEKQYTVVYRKVINRKPYFPQLEDTVAYTFKFTPFPISGPFRIVHLADVHNQDDPAITMATYQNEKTDALILNGDIPGSSGDVAYFDTIYALCEAVTHGEKPIVCTRGNHDLRGGAAERMTDYFPTKDGKTYYTFRLGPVWGLVLDCGEDKNDSHPEYGETVCFESFRKRETAFIKEIVSNADKEFNASGVKYRLIVSHVPFTLQKQGEFDIEGKTYTEWAKLIEDHIVPDLYVCGHEHFLDVLSPDNPQNKYGAKAPILIGADPERPKGETRVLYTGSILDFDEKSVNILFVNQDRQIVKEASFSLKRP